MSKFQVGDLVKVVRTGLGVAEEGIGRFMTVSEIGGIYRNSLMGPGIRVVDEGQDFGYNRVGGDYEGWIGEDSFVKVASFQIPEEEVELILKCSL